MAGEELRAQQLARGRVPSTGMWVSRHTHAWKGFKPILKKLHNYCKVQNKALRTLTHALNYSVFIPYSLLGRAADELMPWLLPHRPQARTFPTKCDHGCQLKYNTGMKMAMGRTVCTFKHGKTKYHRAVEGCWQAGRTRGAAAPIRQLHSVGVTVPQALGGPGKSQGKRPRPAEKCRWAVDVGRLILGQALNVGDSTAPLPQSTRSA